MSPVSTRTTKKRRRESKRTENTEEKSRTVKQPKPKTPAPSFRHRLFAPSPNEENSSKEKEDIPNILTSRSIENSGDSEEGGDIICYRGSAAYDILKQLQHEPDDRVQLSEHPEKTHSWLNDEWNIDLNRDEADSAHEASLSPPVFYHDCQGNGASQDIIRRKEVLPQEKRFKIGHYVSVYRHGVQVGTGTIVEAMHSCLFVVKTNDPPFLLRGRASELRHATLNNARKGGYSGKLIKATFLDCLSDELRIQKELYPRTESSARGVDFGALAKAIAVDAFRKKRLPKPM